MIHFYLQGSLTSLQNSQPLKDKLKYEKPPQQAANGRGIHRSGVENKNKVPILQEDFFSCICILHCANMQVSKGGSQNLGRLGHLGIGIIILCMLLN